MSRNDLVLDDRMVWPAALVFAAVGPLLAGLWWTGAAYAPGIPTLRPDRGVVQMLVAALLLGAATAVCLRWMRPRVPGFLGGWLAALVAGGLVGVVQAAVGLVVDRGPGGDIWPLMVLYVTVADGLAFGACLGWIVGAVTALTTRGSATSGVVAERVPQVAAAVVSTVALGLALAVPATPAAADARPDAPTAVPAGFLRADGTHISDGKGNQVLLRGVNVNQLVDFYQYDPKRPVTRPLTENDYAQMAAQGFTVVRLNISWSALEPTRGTLDPAYLGRITQSVEWGKAHGIYTVLDMHQDGWWNGGTAEGTTCRPGTDVMWGYDGAPEWATFVDGAPRCQFTGRDISPAGDRAFQKFYFDRDGVRGALATTWGALAAHFRDEPMVAGFDLLNEPGFGETAPVTTSSLLGTFYAEAIEEIRAAGAPQIVFVEPSIFWSGLGIDSGPTPGFTEDTNIVFSPHLYAESITMDRDLGLPPIVGLERQFDLAQRVGAEFDAPLWSGEYGYWGEVDDVVGRMIRYARTEDEHILGSTYWVWKQACGDPQNGIQETGDGLLVETCATGADAPAKAHLLTLLSRAYPQSAPGTVTSLEAKGADFRLAGTTAARGCGLRVWVPGPAAPDVETTGLEKVTVTTVAGGSIVTACAQGDYTMSNGG